jgi:hypothetical protein
MQKSKSKELSPIPLGKRPGQFLKEQGRSLSEPRLRVSLQKSKKDAKSESLPSSPDDYHECRQIVNLHRNSNLELCFGESEDSVKRFDPPRSAKTTPEPEKSDV